MDDTSTYLALITIGALLAASIAANWLGTRTSLPRVSLLLLVGVLAGPLVFDVLPAEREEWFDVAARIALVMVGFLIGGEFTAERLRRQGTAVAFITAGQGLGTAVVVAGGLLLAGFDPTVALLLGGVATATDPAATRSVIEDEGARGDAPRTVLGIVALDDVVGIIVFSILLAGAGAIAGTGAVGQELADGLWELGGGVLVGGSLGLVASQLTGRLPKGEPTLEEALAAVFLCAGVTWWLDVSYLIAAVTMGAVVANFAAHHDRPFRAVEGIEWPFLVIFFVLAGAQISRDTLTATALIVGYVTLRTVGKVVGAAGSARAIGIGWRQGIWFGPALLPQAGVALGMALSGAERFPQHADEIVGVAVVSTVLFELVGPIGVRAALPKLEDP